MFHSFSLLRQVLHTEARLRPALGPDPAAPRPRPLHLGGERPRVLEGDRQAHGHEPGGGPGQHGKFLALSKKIATSSDEFTCDFFIIALAS